MKPFEDSFNRIIDTSLKCTRCNGPIFHALGKAEPDVPFNEIYSCSCLALPTKIYFNNHEPLTGEYWRKLAQRPRALRGIALPPPSFMPMKRARGVTEVYNPDQHAKRLKSRIARWKAACADARNAIEELVGIQEATGKIRRLAGEAPGRRSASVRSPA
jgi:hypothetical protein